MSEFRPRPRPFWHRHLEPEERRRVMHDLALITRTHWHWRFSVMLALSVIVAVMGLLAGSAAVVIGAMLLAPLMTPVLGTAAALAMGLPRKALVSGLRVVVATVGCIALAYLASKVALTSSVTLSSEIESRTRPDVRDLMVALAAGAAGSYATVRADASSSLPGVAVAVALVPPLATVGITLEAGNMVWAQGALLLYLTNLVAIVFVSIIVFLVTGFVPPRRVATTVPRIVAAMAVTVIAVVAISVPLLRASIGAADASQRDIDARAAVRDWLGDLQLDLVEIDLDGNPVIVELSGVGQPPAKELLEERLSQILNVPVQAAIFVDETRQATTTTTAPITDAERRESRTRDVVAEWLAANDDGNNYQLNAFALEGNDLLVTVSGVGAQPPILDLIDRLTAADPSDVITPSVQWSQLQEVPIGEEPPTPLEVTTAELRVIVDDWARPNLLRVTAFEFDGTNMEVDVEGAAPAPIEPLLTAIAESDLDRADEIVSTVFFTQRVQLETTTTTLPELLIPDFGDAPVAPGESTTTSSTTTP